MILSHIMNLFSAVLFLFVSSVFHNGYCSSPVRTDPDTPVMEMRDDCAIDHQSLRMNLQPGVLIVKFRSLQAESLLKAIHENRNPKDVFAPGLQVLNTKYGFQQVESLFPSNVAFPDKKRLNSQSPLPRMDHLFKLHFSQAVDMEAVANAYSREPHVAYAEPNHVVNAVWTPNDEFFNPDDLWGLSTVDAEAAWDIANGTGVVVAVIDSGVDILHPDLQSNIYINPGEIAGNGMDDDGNGFVDDIYGWDFSDHDNNPMDTNGHGTHVSGTIAGVADNLYGVAGLAHGCRIMAVRGLNTWGSGYDTDLVQSIQYAAMNGAQVINNSWGGEGRSQAYQDAVDFAHGMGVVVVCAAGNNNKDASGFTPANIETAITVSAFTRDDLRASYSNFGTKLDVAAPGGVGGAPGSTSPAADILSTVSNSAYLETGYGHTVIYGSDAAKYMAISGTSMAAPHVSALAALILDAHPAWSNETVRQVIRQSVEDVSAPGFDTDSGYGRINAYNALTISAAPPESMIQEPITGSTVNGVVQITGTSDASNFDTYIIEIGAGETPTSFATLTTGNTPVVDGVLAQWDTRNNADGVYTVRLRTLNSLSAQSEDRNSVSVDNIYISSPVNYQLISQVTSIDIMGRVTEGSITGSPELQNYELSYAPGFNPTPGTFVSIYHSTSPVDPEGLLGNWDMAGVPDGPMTLRLTAAFSTYSTTHDVKVIVDKFLRSGWPVDANNPNSWTFKSPLVADLDRNGEQEIILGAAVFQSDGSVRPGWGADPSLGRSNPAIVDVDGDGRLEVVAATMTQWYSDPSFPPEENYGAPVIHAYNADGLLDADGLEDWNHFIFNPLAGAAYSSGIISTITAGDVDGDGMMEIVFLVWFNWNNLNHETTLCILNAADGTLENQFNITATSLSTPALGDLDGDGALEIIVSAYENSGDDYLHALNADGTQVPGWPLRFNSEGSGVSNPVVADIDLDGDLEVLLGEHLVHHDGTDCSGWPAMMMGRSTGAIVPLGDPDLELEVITGGANMLLLSAYDHDGALKFHRWAGSENLYVFLAGENGRQGDPIVTDIDGDGSVEIMRSHEMGFTDGRPLPIYGCEGLNMGSPLNFPRYVLEPGMIVRSTVAVDDIDCNGFTDMLVAAGGKIYVWEFPVTFDPGNNPWPMFMHDLAHTGNLQTMSATGCIELPTPIPTNTPNPETPTPIGPTPTPAPIPVSSPAGLAILLLMFTVFLTTGMIRRP